jgi:vacuolar-type H+-ATPase subunit H
MPPLRASAPGMNARADDGIAGASIASRNGSRAGARCGKRMLTKRGRPVTESGMKGRVKGLLTAASPVTEPSAQTESSPSDPSAQRQALQVLTLAQRTADEHVATAHRQADKICADARATAQQIVQDAEARVGDLRREADKTLSDACATAEQMARDAQTHADDTRRNADKILSDARARAEEIAKDAQANADELQDQAQQRYQDVVGSLAGKREALQRQIEALEEFDRDYRARLTTFLQSQLRALWVDEPHVDAEIEQPGSVATSGPLSAQTSH